MGFNISCFFKFHTASFIFNICDSAVGESDGKKEVNIGKFVHGTIALWVGDLKRARELIEDFLNDVTKISYLFNKNYKEKHRDKLMEILRRPKKVERRESNRQFYNDDIFIYGPLFIRALNVYEKVSYLLLERDKIGEKEQVEISERKKFGFLITEIGINNFELRGYSLYPPVQINLNKFKEIKDEIRYSEKDHIKIIDSASDDTIHSLTLEILKYEPFTFMQTHITKEGIIYGKANSFNKEQVHKITRRIFEILDRITSH